MISDRRTERTFCNGTPQLGSFFFRPCRESPNHPHTQHTPDSSLLASRRSLPRTRWLPILSRSSPAAPAQQIIEMSSSSIKASALLLLAAQLGCGQDLTSCEPSTNGAFDYQVRRDQSFHVATGHIKARVCVVSAVVAPLTPEFAAER